MTGLLGILALGFFLGMRHATDPDHVIAVTTIVARQRSARGAAMIGAVWGIGHTLTILVVGGAIIIFRWVIPARVGLSMELSVGVMLCVLGIINLRGVVGWIREVASTAPTASEHVHSHAHSHGDYVHSHVHGHVPEVHPHAPEQTPVGWLDRQLGGVAAYQLVRPLAIGVVHGLAGSAAVALLVLATIKSSTWALAYLLVFGVGTIAGMMLITAAISIPFAVSGPKLSHMNRGLRIASGVLSLAFGLFVAYEVGIVGGLFTGTPVWTPH